MKSASKKTILLVEDEIPAAKAEKKTLEKHGFRVLHVVSGEEAVEAVENNPSIGLVLMDINLGDGIDGSLAAKKILKKKNIPLIFLLSHTEREVVKKTEEIASYGYIVKNSGETVLAASIRTALRLHDSRLKEKAKALRENKKKTHEVSNHDIVDCKTAEEALRKSEEKYRTLVETTDTGFLIIDRNGRVVDANREYVRLSGHRELGEILGRRVTEWTAEHLMQKNAEAVEQCVRNGLIRNLVVEYVNGSGHTTPVEINATVVGDGESMRIISLCRDITERRKAEEALRESEKKYRLIADNTADNIWVTDMNMRPIYVSPSVSRIRGYTAEEAMTQSIDKIITPFSLPLAIQALKEELELEKMPGADPCRIRVLELEEYHKNGSTLWLENTISFMRDDSGTPIGILGVTRDISGRRRAEEALRESEEKFRSLVENITEVIYTLDSGGRITYMSPMAYQVSGYTADDLIGKNFINFVYPEDLPGLLESYQRTIGGMIEPYEYRIINKDGSVRHIRTSSRAIGDPPVINGVMSDITERKQAEEKIRSLLAEKELFLREVHHRIKNNITSIGSFLSLQSQAVTSPEAISALKDAMARVNSMAFLYDSLMASVDYRETSVKRYAGKIIDTVMAIFPGKDRISINKLIEDFNLDPSVLFPLGLVINELITNVMKYAFTGRDSGVIDVRLTRDDKGVTLVVQDNGIGIPDGFDIKKSTGFGFFLVDMLVEQLKGIFIIEKNNGTRCVLEFRV